MHFPRAELMLSKHGCARKALRTPFKKPPSKKLLQNFLVGEPLRFRCFQTKRTSGYSTGTPRATRCRNPRSRPQSPSRSLQLQGRAGWPAAIGLSHHSRKHQSSNPTTPTAQIIHSQKWVTPKKGLAWQTGVFGSIRVRPWTIWMLAAADASFPSQSSSCALGHG